MKSTQLFLVLGVAASLSAGACASPPASEEPRSEIESKEEGSFVVRFTGAKMTGYADGPKAALMATGNMKLNQDGYYGEAVVELLKHDPEAESDEPTPDADLLIGEPAVWNEQTHAGQVVTTSIPLTKRDDVARLKLRIGKQGGGHDFSLSFEAYKDLKDITCSAALNGLWMPKSSPPDYDRTVSLVCKETPSE
jgi:hypothetical protein